MLVLTGTLALTCRSLHRKRSTDEIRTLAAPFRVYAKLRCALLMGLLTPSLCELFPPFTTKSDLGVALVEFCANQGTAEATHGPISAWNVSAVTDMKKLIYNAPCKTTFNSDVNAWNVGQVTNMQVRLASEGPPPCTAA